MDNKLNESNQVPTTEGDTGMHKSDVSTNHSLGLQDLYKAAFSQEPSDDFNDFDKNTIIEPHLIADSEAKFYDAKKDEKSESDLIYKNSHFEEAYQLYTLKSIPYTVDFKKNDEKDSAIKVGHLSYLEQCTEVQKPEFQDAGLTTTPVILHRSYGHYENEDTNSVLDLDKGIQIQVVKVNDATDNSNLNYAYGNREYSGDSQILHRYLCDSAFLKSESNDISNPSSGPDSLTFLHKQNNNDGDKSFYDDKNVGINPESLGVRFEDCDFNSSDSFASTESIIPKKIQCSKCPKKFMFKSDLLRHDKHKHSVKPKLSCKYCNKEFASQQNLVFHEKSHKKRTANRCEMCKKIFKKPGFLVKHMMKKHSKSTPYSCGQCSKVFTSQLLLNNHYKRYHVPESDKPYKCEICSKSFEKKQGLTCHAKLHSEEQPYVCNICNKAFSKICYLKNHQKSHTTEEKDSFVCDTCGKDFKTSNALQEHSRKHTGEKPYTCNVCMKSFAYKAYFKVHIRKHAEVKPFVCSYCQKSFVTSTDLNKHERSHTKEKPYHCINCNQSFSQQSNLITHWKKQRCNNNKTQEICTQTTEFDILDPNAVTVQNVDVQNVNVVVDESFANQQPIVLTSIGSFINSNSVPVILAQNSSIPYSISSIPS